MLECLAIFARELGRFPVANEIKLKARTEPGFPWHNTFSRFGGKQKLAERLREFALTRGWHDVAALCDTVIVKPSSASRTLPRTQASNPNRSSDTYT